MKFYERFTELGCSWERLGKCWLKSVFLIVVRHCSGLLLCCKYSSRVWVVFNLPKSAPSTWGSYLVLLEQFQRPPLDDKSLQ